MRIMFDGKVIDTQKDLDYKTDEEFALFLLAENKDLREIIQKTIDDNPEIFSKNDSRKVHFVLNSGESNERHVIFYRSKKDED